MNTPVFRSLVMVILTLLVVTSASAFEPAPMIVKSEKDVPTGGTININTGNCGVTLLNAPEKGTLVLENNITPLQPKGLKFYKKACELTYEDAGGIKIVSTKGAMINFINLTNEERALWDSGDLGFYVYNGNTWSACTPHFVSAGENGRLACRTDNVGMFSLVDTSVKVEEED